MATVGGWQVTLRVIVFQEGDDVHAQCLEYDIAARGRTVGDCLYQLHRLVVGHLAVADENKMAPFHGLPKAPERFWRWFHESRIPLLYPLQPFTADQLSRRGVVVEQPEIRVAQPQAA